MKKERTHEKIMSDTMLEHLFEEGDNKQKTMVHRTKYKAF